MAKVKTRRNGARSGKSDIAVLTLRIRPQLKLKLNAYCSQLSRARGRRVSYNEGITELIEAAP